MEAGVDAFDLKNSAGDNGILFASLSLPDGQIGQTLVLGSHLDGAAPIHRGLIHMDNDRLQQGGHGCRCRLLDECVHALGDVGDHDAA